MEIIITRFFNEACFKDYSASIMEVGQNAAKDTWQAACDDSAQFYLLNNKDKREAFREHVKGFGAWPDKEIAAWDNTELNALFLQLISGDAREAFSSFPVTDEAWQEYEDDENMNHCLFKGVDGEIYYYVGS